jgi:predicted metal-dependent hydrolase
MHALLRYTLDLFEPFEAVAPVEPAQAAPKKIVNSAPSQPFVAGQPLQQAIAPAAFTHPQANREVRLDGAVVAYAFARAKRRTIGFVVGPDGLVVRAPRWTPLYEVDAALQEKGPWILRKLHETRERHARQENARIDWRDGATFPYLGDTLVVQLDPGHGFAAKGAALQAPDPAGGPRVLQVGLPHNASTAQIRDAVQAWLMRQAKTLFTERLDYFAPLLGVKWQKMGLSNAGTRWGSARADGAIRLNWRLVHFSPAVVDYVVAHELSHLRVMDHSPRFWDTVRSVVPDYASLRGQLSDDAIPKW